MENDAPKAEAIGSRPWFTVGADGVPRIHVPLTHGNSMSYPMTLEGAAEFAAEVQAKLGGLAGNPELQKKLGAKAVGLLVDLLSKRGTP